MINEYTKGGQHTFARATLITIVVNLLLQMGAVYALHSKRGKREQLRELLFVVTYVKPGVDVWRVVSRQKQAVNAAVPPVEEMAYTKGIELFTECIPGTVIQTMAIVNGD